VTSACDVDWQEVEQLFSCDGNELTMDPASALTAFYRVDAACSIADNARKMDAMLMLSGRRFAFGYSLSWHHNTPVSLR